MLKIFFNVIIYYLCVFRLFNGKSTEDLESIEENTKIKANNLDPGKKESFKEFLSASFSKNHEKKGSKVSKLHFILYNYYIFYSMRVACYIVIDSFSIIDYTLRPIPKWFFLIMNLISMAFQSTFLGTTEITDHAAV